MNDKRIKAILVENDEDELFYMQEGFVSSGCFEVMGVANNGEELFNLINNNRKSLPELIVSDLNMPGKNGLDIIKEIKNTLALSHIPVVILSTSSSPFYKESSLNAGALAYFTKPDTFNYIPIAEKVYDKCM